MMLGLVGFAVLALVVTWHFRLSRAIAPRQKVLAFRKHYPSVTVIRPVRGKDVGAARQLRAPRSTPAIRATSRRSSCSTTTSDPGPAHRRARSSPTHIAPRPPRHAPTSSSPARRRAGRTGKLNAMVVGAARAPRGELIAFGDSDTRPDHDVLRGIVETLLASPAPARRSRRCSSTSAARPPATCSTRSCRTRSTRRWPRAPSGEPRELPFIMGQLMVFRREALAAIGGVESAQGQLVDDMAIGKRVHEAGYKNVMSRSPLHIATGGMTLRAVPAGLPPLDDLLAQRAAAVVHVAPVAAGRGVLRRARRARRGARHRSLRWRRSCRCAALVGADAPACSCSIVATAARRFRRGWRGRRGRSSSSRRWCSSQNMLKRASSGAAASTS